MKKLIILIIVLSFVLPVGLAGASDISRANYYGTVRATNSSTVATNVAANFTANTTQWIAAGILNASATNVVMRDSAGNEVAVQPAYGSNTWITWFDTVPASGSQDNTIYTGNVTGGKIRYFPASGGMTTNDNNTNFEPGANFTFEDKGGFDTSAASSKYIRYRASAFRTFINGAGNITSSIIVPGSAIIYPDGNGDYTNIASATANHWDDVDDAAASPDDATTKVYTNSATEQKDVYTLQNGSFTANMTIDSVVIYFRGYSATTPRKIKPYLRLGTNETAGTEQDLPAATWTSYNETLARPGGGSWTYSDIASLQAGIGLKSDAANPISCTQVYVKVNYTEYLSVTKSGVSSGEHTVRTIADGTHMWVTVDGSPSSNVTLGAFAVPNNSNNWVSFQNNAMPYIEYSKSWIGGVLKQYIYWEWGATFNDHSPVGDNDATPTFRTTASDSDVTTTLISFTPISRSVVDSEISGEWPSMITTAPDEPATTYTEESRPGIFFEPLIHAIWPLSGVPESFFWYNFAFIIILAAGMLVFYAFAKNNQSALLAKMITMAAIMIFWALPGPNIYGMYVVIYFGFWCFGIMVLSRSYGW